jgi:Tfp pilus assembly protein PilF
MTNYRPVICVVVLLTAAPVLAQDWRGMGRLAGRVTDESGAPIDGVAVKGHRAESQGGPETKTNKKGEWTFAGINNGQWDVDFEKPGYETFKTSVAVLENSPNPPMNVKLKKAAVDPNTQIKEDLAKAGALMQQQKYAEARAIYQDILTKHPEAYQVEPYIARTYYGEHQIDAAIEHLRNALAKDPNNAEVKLLLAHLLEEQGSTEESRQIIASIDESKITDPATLLNVGIGLLNQKKPADALTWFDKAVTRFPQSADGYYYRGITELQLEKTNAAKADLTKFLEMAPNAPEAATARGILEKIK